MPLWKRLLISLLDDQRLWADIKSQGRDNTGELQVDAGLSKSSLDQFEIHGIDWSAEQKSWWWSGYQCR